jgi:hypothetical protein
MYIPPQAYCQGFSRTAVVSINLTAEKRPRFHPHAPSGTDENHLDRPCKMKPPPDPSVVPSGQFWPFPWGVSPLPPNRPGRIGMNFLRPGGRMKMGNLCFRRQRKINLAEIQ